MLFGCSTVDFKSYFWMWKMTRYYSENCRQWHFFGEKFFFSFPRKKSSDKILSDRTSVHWWRLDAPTHLIPPFSTNAPFCVLTYKRTDVWSRDFIVWKINFGLRAVVWAGLRNKRFLADYEQFLRPVFLVFMDKKIILKFFENILGSALKSCIE